MAEVETGGGEWRFLVFWNSKNVHMFLADGGGIGKGMCERG